MPSGNYLFADISVNINSIHTLIHDMSADYITDKPTDIKIDISQADIDYERMKSKAEDELEGIEVRVFPDNYLETLSVLRKLSEKAIDYDVLLMHGSTVAVDGEAYIFTAKSGVGKSTHTALWREYFGDRAVAVNDDKPFIRVKDDKAYACGSVWNGKHGISSNISVPLKAICFLTRGLENEIHEIPFSEGFPKLLSQIHRPEAPEGFIRELALIDKISQTVKFYELKCNISLEAVEVAYRGMNK